MGRKGDREREREEELISHQHLEDVKWVEACHRPSIKSKQQT